MSVDALTAFRITNALHTMMQALDTGDARRFAEQFDATNGKIIVEKIGKMFQGRSSIEGMCTALHQKFAGAQHFEGNIVLEELESGRVRNVSYWKCVSSSGSIISMGTHDDVFVESSDGKWICETRRIRHAPLVKHKAAL